MIGCDDMWWVVDWLFGCICWLLASWCVLIGVKEVLVGDDWLWWHLVSSWLVVWRYLLVIGIMVCSDWCQRSACRRWLVLMTFGEWLIGGICWLLASWCVLIGVKEVLVGDDWFWWHVVSCWLVVWMYLLVIGIMVCSDWCQRSACRRWLVVMTFGE